MAKYMIHVCNARLWYVNRYLLPSMLMQGINQDDITVYLDRENEGCLTSCVKSFDSLRGLAGGTWHLQDDVIISSDFKDKTEQYDSGTVCAYCWEKDRRWMHRGRVSVDKMWYSFPCIRIPNQYAAGFVDWFNTFAVKDLGLQTLIRTGKYDDSLFMEYMAWHQKKEIVLNLRPNLVDHIDYMIGGSQINSLRESRETPAAYFKEPELVEELKRKLGKD